MRFVKKILIKKIAGSNSGLFGGSELQNEPPHSALSVVWNRRVVRERGVRKRGQWQAENLSSRDLGRSSIFQPISSIHVASFPIIPNFHPSPFPNPLQTTKTWRKKKKKRRKRRRRRQTLDGPATPARTSSIPSKTSALTSNLTSTVST